MEWKNLKNILFLPVTQLLLLVKGRTQTITFTCEGKNINNDFYL
jgi:hypothetical protein